MKEVPTNFKSCSTKGAEPSAPHILYTRLSITHIDVGSGWLRVLILTFISGSTHHMAERAFSNETLFFFKMHRF